MAMNQRTSSRRRAGAFLVVLIALLLVPSNAALAAVFPPVPPTPFAIATPNYCAKGDGVWQDAYLNHVDIVAGTFSLSAPGGVCNTPAPGYYNQFAAQVRLEFRANSSSPWGICRTGPHKVNQAGYAEVDAGDVVLKCGSGWQYRLRTEHRIIYYGVTYTATFYSSAVQL